MPTLLRVDGYRFFFYSNEGTEPPHVHVSRGDANAKFWLSPVELASSSRLRPTQQRRLRELVREYEHEFIEAWELYFG
jgi:hypothetical protein